MKINKPLLKTKLKASAIHLSLSAVVFIYLAYRIYYDWYPQPYFAIDGGWQGIRLIAAVDLVLGPLITFLIFDLRKSRREIVFDLAVILVIQLGSLAYGIHTAYDQRPVAIVMYGDVLLPVTSAQFAGTLESPDQLRRYSDQKPPVIYARVPSLAEDMKEVLRIKAEENIIELAQMQLYRPHSKLVEALQKRQPSALAQLERKGGKPAFDEWLESNGKSRDGVLVERFFGRYGNAWLVFDLDGNYLDYFALQFTDLDETVRGGMGAVLE